MTRVKVGIRARPLTQQEKESGDEIVIRVSENSVVLKKQIDKSREFGGEGHRRFNYDYCFWSVDPKHPEYASQQTIYDTVGIPIVESLLKGYNACVFTYGQSGSGKTYTVTGSKTEVGLLPRLCEDLYSKIEAREKHYKAELNFSYVEIYKERVHDLLRPATSGALQSLRVREHPLFGPFLEGLSKHKVSGVQDVISLVENAKNVWNAIQTSSGDQVKRSHSIFTLSCSQISGKTDRKLTSELHLVDLAGSETVPLNGCLRDHQDITNINKSLVTLGIVISSLASRSFCSRRSYVPFRNSVLTWLLKETLGGNCITCMIATVSPSAKHYKNTLSTLRYAERAGNILNIPIVNETPRTEFGLVQSLRSEIDSAKSVIVARQMANGINLEKAAMVASMDSLDSLNDVPEIPSRTISSSWEEVCGKLGVHKVHKSRSFDRFPTKPTLKHRLKAYSVGSVSKKLSSACWPLRERDLNVMDTVMNDTCIVKMYRRMNERPKGIENNALVKDRACFENKVATDRAASYENAFVTRALDHNKRPDSDKSLEMNNKATLVLNTARIETLSSFSSEKLLPPQSLFFQLRKIPSKNSLDSISDDKIEFRDEVNHYRNVGSVMLDSLESPGNDSGFREISDSNTNFPYEEAEEQGNEVTPNSVGSKDCEVKENGISIMKEVEDEDEAVNILVDKLQNLHVTESDPNTELVRTPESQPTTLKVLEEPKSQLRERHKAIKRIEYDKELRAQNAQRYQRRRSSYSTDSVEGYNNVTSSESLEVFNPRRDPKSFGLGVQGLPQDVVEEQKVPFTLRDPGTPDSGFASSRVFPALRNTTWSNGCQPKDKTQDQFRDAESTSSSTSSDSITYVFLDQRLSNGYQKSFRLSEEKSSASDDNEPASVIDLLRCNKPSNANSTVTLDSLEVCKDDTTQCRSPRALSVDSVAAEEYFKMMGNEAPHGINKKEGRPTFNLVSKQCFTTTSNMFSGGQAQSPVKRSVQREDAASPDTQAYQKHSQVSCPASTGSSTTSVATSKNCSISKTANINDSKDALKQKPVDSDLVKLMSDVVSLLTTLQKQNHNTETINAQPAHSCCCCQSQSSSSSNDQIENGNEHRKTIRSSLRDEIRILRQERDHVRNLLHRQEHCRQRLRFNQSELPSELPQAKKANDSSKYISNSFLKSAENSTPTSRRSNLSGRFQSRQVFTTRISPQSSVSNDVFSARQQQASTSIDSRYDQNGVQSRQWPWSRSRETSRCASDLIADQSCPQGTASGCRSGGKFVDRVRPKENCDVKATISASYSKRSGQLPFSTTPSVVPKSRPVSGKRIEDLFDDYFGPDLFRELPNQFTNKKSFFLPIPDRRSF